MGAGAATGQPLPDLISREMFKQLAGDMYSDHIFDSFKNEDGFITKDKMHGMKEMVSQTHLLREKFNQTLVMGKVVLNVAQLEGLIKLLGYEPTEQDLADPNGDRVINFIEFMNIMLSKMSNLNYEKEILETFSIFDLNGDGFITADELRDVMNDMGENVTDSEAVAMIAEADIDHDGRISLQEYSMKMA